MSEDSLAEKAPTKEEAQKLIQVIVDETGSFTADWVKSYNDLNSIFLERAFDIGGFQCSQFVKHGLKKHNIDSVGKLGTIFEELEKRGATYLQKFPQEKKRKERILFGEKRNLSRGIFQFIEDLKNRKGGVYGRKYYEAINSFFEYKDEEGIKILKGFMVWKILWAYCYNSRYLKEHYNGSFKTMVKEKAEEWLRDHKYEDEIIEKFPKLDLTVNEWENIVSYIVKEIQRELKYVGEELAPYLLRDVREFSKAEKVLFKLDSINEAFIKKSGLIFLPCKEGIKTLDELKNEWNERQARRRLYLEIVQLANPKYSIQSINRNLYVYSANPHKKDGFGYCWTEEDCKRCNGEDVCLSGQLGIKYVMKELKKLGFK